MSTLLLIEKSMTPRLIPEKTSLLLANGTFTHSLRHFHINLHMYRPLKYSLVHFPGLQACMHNNLAHTNYNLLQYRSKFVISLLNSKLCSYKISLYKIWVKMKFLNFNQTEKVRSKHNNLARSVMLILAKLIKKHAV